MEKMGFPAGTGRAAGVAGGNGRDGRRLAETSGAERG
jgi:hypothetical protein